MQDDDELEYVDDASLSPRSQLLSPGTVRSVLQRPRAPDAYSAIDPHLDTALDDEHHHMPRREAVIELPLDLRGMRRLLRETSEKLEAATKRANKAEHYARDARARTVSLEKHYQTSRENNVKTSEELKRYKQELQIAQQQVQIAQDEINSLAAERDRAESDAARARDLARKATEQLKVQQAREDGKKVGFEEGRQAAMLEARAQMEEVRAEMEQALLQGSQRQKRHSRRRSENDILRDAPRRPSGGSDLDIPGPSRHNASLTPIPEAQVELTPGGMPANLHMPVPYPMHDGASAGNPVSQQEIPAFHIIPPDQSQYGLPALNVNGQDPYGMPGDHLAPAAPRIINSPVPPRLSVHGDGTPSFGGNLGMPAFAANIIPPTPQPSSPAAQGGSYFASAPMRGPSPGPGPMTMPNRAPSPLSMRGPSPGPGIIAPSPQMAPARGWSLDEPVRPPSSNYSRNIAGPSGLDAYALLQETVQEAVQDAVESIMSEPQRKKKKKRNRHQDASGDVDLTITPASPDESSGSSSDEGRSTRTGKSTQRGADAPGMLSPRHIPRPPSRRSSPHGSRSSSPHVVVHDMMSGGPVRVSAREAQDLLEQEELERAREADRQAQAMANRSPRRQSMGGPPSMTPSSHAAPLPVLPPPPPIPVHEPPPMPVYEPPAARGKRGKKKGGARGRGAAATTQQREVQFPPSTGTSHIEPFIPPDPGSSSANYVAAPHAPAYPAPVTPVGGHRPLGAPGYVPSPGSGPFPLPSLIPDGPVIPGGSGMPSRPASRGGGMPPARPYEAAPGAPVYPPPLTPRRSQLAMGASPAGSHRSLSHGRRGEEEDGATFTMPEGGWTWNAGRS